MNTKQTANIIAATIGCIVLMFCGIGIYDTASRCFTAPPAIQAQDSATYISGPVAANVGELCVFRLSDSTMMADWVIVPPADCYIDSSGSSLAFASNVPAQYTIVAAVVEGSDKKVPKILLHVCDYGISDKKPSPPPNPGPAPNPAPSPTPGPQPPPGPESLRDWVRQNIPDTGRQEGVILAACYEAVADAIDTGTIQSQAAAFSSIRTNTQAKITTDVFDTFLDGLSAQIQIRLDGSTDVKALGKILREIADGLASVNIANQIRRHDEITVEFT
jgi:hypothetical protein